MRKMYIQPKNEISKVAPMKVVCASGEFDTSDEVVTGQAPERGAKVYWLCKKNTDF